MKKTILEKLKAEKEELARKHLFKGFATPEELDEYRKNNEKDLIRLQKLMQEIRELEWELMSEEERKEYIEYQKKLKEKYSDE